MTQVAGSDGQQARVRLVMPVKNSNDQSSTSTVQLVSTDTGDLTVIPVHTVHDHDSRQSATLRTLPEARISSPTYIILKLSGNDVDNVPEKVQRSSSGGIVAGQSVELGDKVKYIDLNALLSKSHLSVTPSPTSRRRPPTSRRRPTRPRTATKPARRRPPRPPLPTLAPPTPSPSGLRPRPPPPPQPRPAPPPAPSQELRHDKASNYDQQQSELSGYNSDQLQYYPRLSQHRHHHQQYHHQRQPQQEYSLPNEHHHHSHLAPRYEARPGAILPRFRPTPV